MAALKIRIEKYTQRQDKDAESLKGIRRLQDKWIEKVVDFVENDEEVPDMYVDPHTYRVLLRHFQQNQPPSQSTCLVNALFPLVIRHLYLVVVYIFQCVSLVLPSILGNALSDRRQIKAFICLRSDKAFPKILGSTKDTH